MELSNILLVLVSAFTRGRLSRHHQWSTPGTTVLCELAQDYHPVLSPSFVTEDSRSREQFHGCPRLQLASIYTKLPYASFTKLNWRSTLIHSSCHSFQLVKVNPHPIYSQRVSIARNLHVPIKFNEYRKGAVYRRKVNDDKRQHLNCQADRAPWTFMVRSLWLAAQINPII